MFRSISRGWAFIKEAFSMAFSNRALLKPSVYLVLATILGVPREILNRRRNAPLEKM